MKSNSFFKDLWGILEKQKKSLEVVSFYFLQNVYIFFYKLSYHNMLQNSSSRLEVLRKKGVLRNFAKFTGKHLCQSLFFNKDAGLRLAQVFSYEFCEISKNIFFDRTPPVAASVQNSKIF